MQLPERLVLSVGYEHFKKHFFRQHPFVAHQAAPELRKLLGWPLLLQIFESRHQNCWLAHQGKLHPNENLNQGSLNLQEAMNAFEEGYTILVRHSEAAHPELKKIAQEFQQFFESDIDVQIFGTPELKQGFDWHYDSEEVFIIQSSGTKEFRLRKNRKSNPISFSKFPKNANLEEEMESSEMRIKLGPGDFLYIPAGYWHCAQALAPSFHLSIGVTLLV